MSVDFVRGLELDWTRSQDGDRTGWAWQELCHFLEKHRLLLPISYLKTNPMCYRRLA